MTQGKGAAFESKVADLVAVTHRLDVSRILLLRRLTLSDPQSLKWASARQLELIFNVILAKALERTSAETLGEASSQHFDPLLPDGPEDVRDKERWLLFDLAKPFLAGARGEASAAGTTQAVLDELEAEGETAVPASYDDFGSLFDDTVSRHLKRTLSVLAARGSRPHIPPPFFAGPGFAACYLQLLRTSILPVIRASRRLKELAASRNWSEEGAASRIIGMIQSGEANNPILHHWDTRWRSFHPEYVEKGKDGKPKPRKPEDNPWPMFNEDAAKHGYIPPYPSDLLLLQRLARLDGDQLADAWDQLAQMYEQEFQPKTRAEQGRPGSFRDGLLRFIDALPDHGGDLLAIRAFFDFAKMDRQFLKQLVQILGRSDMERDKRAPLLVAFFNDLPK